MRKKTRELNFKDEKKETKDSLFINISRNRNGRNETLRNSFQTKKSHI